MKVAVIQMNAGDDKSRNIRKAIDFVRQAVGRGAQFILLPEVFSYRGEGLLREAELIPGKSLKPLMAIARQYRIFILAGSIYERSKKKDKAYNTSALINSRAALVAKYRKRHLFEAVIKGRHIRESDYLLAGQRSAITSVGQFKVALSICYDIRFPEMYQGYARRGAHVICVPSAFTYETGKAHWEVLLRARAIENRCYVLAPNQVGLGGGARCYGHSMIVGPWGEILAEASGAREEIIYADLNMNEIVAGKRVLPAWGRSGQAMMEYFVVFVAIIVVALVFYGKSGMVGQFLNTTYDSNINFMVTMQNEILN